jgi:glutamyl-Q tRNA(Asp) synthetase
LICNPDDMNYRGRFAPSPTGPLHIGSLVAAVASYLEAKTHDGEWLVRIEDLDPPREVAGAAADIVNTLAAHGFQWDGEIVYQSRRGPDYRAALAELQDAGLIYPCACSRKGIADSALSFDKSRVYPGTCRGGLLPGRDARAWRVRVPSDPIRFTDEVCGEQQQDLAQEVGDFVVLRADGEWAYQLAVVVDDHLQGITHIVRGEDLLDSTPRQVYLQRCLGYTTPVYAHVPVVVNARGEKLSKQTGATALDNAAPIANLSAALRHLNHAPPAQAQRSVAALWDWALENWRLSRIGKWAESATA